MPILGADMEKGTLIAWKKQPGERVGKGEIIAEVETDKAAIEVESFTAGVIEKLLVMPGEVVPVGSVMAIIRTEGEVGAPPSGAVPSTAAPPVTVSPVATTPLPSPAATPEPGRLKISPSARQLARELDVDPAGVTGTGPDGAITRADIERMRGERVAAKKKETAADTAIDRQTRMRQVIAAAMARSKREIPHYYLGTSIDLGRAMAWLAEENGRRPVADRLLPGVLLIKAVALALREVPELNALWKGTEAVRSDAIHVGVAISLRQGGLMAPALHHADRQSLGDLMRKLQDLVKRARAGTLRSSELSDSTITVTSLGEQSVETVYGVIYPPQVALVGFGQVVQRPWVVEGRVEARPIVTATLSADHRVTDGHRGARYLAAVDRLLQEPERL